MGVVAIAAESHYRCPIFLIFFSSICVFYALLPPARSCGRVIYKKNEAGASSRVQRMHKFCKIQMKESRRSRMVGCSAYFTTIGNINSGTACRPTVFL